MKADESGRTNKYKLTERQIAILDEIQADPAVQVEMLMEKLTISRSTVMRDIQEIKKTVSLKYDKKIQKWILE